MKEKKQLLRDSNIVPTSLILSEGLGKQYKTYKKFISELLKYDTTNNKYNTSK